jgi:bifunctional non-homologous end joining protein LigD
LITSSKASCLEGKKIVRGRNDNSKLPRFTPAGLVRRQEAFDHSDFLFELKYDGWRALAYLEDGRSELVSRKGNALKSFESLRAALARLGLTSVLDGEIVCLDAAGKPRFYDLFRRRGEPVFYAFDCLYREGEDLRSKPTIERKRILKDLVRGQPRILYANHIETHGIDLFKLVCEQDLEGIVAKHRWASYGSESLPWVKVLNPAYSQHEGRREFFDRKRRAKVL